MIIMKSFSESNKRRQLVISWIDVSVKNEARNVPLKNIKDFSLFKGSHSIHVSGRIDEPSSVNSCDPTIDAEKERCAEGFTPVKPWNQRWNNKGHQNHQRNVIFVLKHNDRVGFQVAHVNLRPKLFHVWMLFTKQPANVREEESTTGVVRVSVCVTKLMMDPKGSSSNFRQPFCCIDQLTCDHETIRKCCFGMRLFARKSSSSSYWRLLYKIYA